MDDLRRLSILMGGAQWAVRFAHDNPELFRAYIARNAGVSVSDLPSNAAFQQEMGCVLEMLQTAAADAQRDFDSTVITLPPEITNY